MDDGQESTVAAGAGVPVLMLTPTAQLGIEFMLFEQPLQRCGVVEASLLAGSLQGADPGFG